MHTAPSLYSQFQPEDRTTLAGLMHQKHSFSVISRMLHCSYKSINRNLRCNADVIDCFRVQAKRCRQYLQPSVRLQSRRHVKARYLNPAYHVTLKHRSLEKNDLSQASKRLKKAHQIRVPYARIHNGIFPQLLKKLCLKLVANLPSVFGHVGRSEDSQTGRRVPMWMSSVMRELLIKNSLHCTLAN